LGLRWIRSIADPVGDLVPAPEGARGGLSSIPEAKLEALRAAANRGDVAAVRSGLDLLADAHPESVDWIRELSALARSYQMTALRQRLNVPKSPDA
jgi:hypothetical protein